MSKASLLLHSKLVESLPYLAPSKLCLELVRQQSGWFCKPQAARSSFQELLGC